MSDRGPHLFSPHWELEIAEDQWPDALLAAVRVDVGALATPRAVASLRAWQAASVSADPSARARARGHLQKLAAILTSDEHHPIPTERLDTVALLQPRPGTPDAPELTAWAHDRSGWVREEESAAPFDPLLADLIGDPAPLRAPSTRMSARDLDAELDDDDTAHLAPPLGEFADEPPTTAIPVFLGARSSAARPLPPPVPPTSSVGPPPLSPDTGGRPAGARPNVVRRATAALPVVEPPRPRAALVQVRPLYAAIQPLCRELIPLPPARRARRFWTHWREASGDRGVRRDVAEQILETARDVRGLASELIAEVQSVEPESVRVLIDRLDAEARRASNPAEPPAVPRATDGRGPRGPLVGAVVRVDELPFEDE